MRECRVVSSGSRLLVMQTDRFTLRYSAESVSVSVASSVHEFSASTGARVEEVFGEGAAARSTLRWQVARICGCDKKK